MPDIIAQDNNPYFEPEIEDIINNEANYREFVFEDDFGDLENFEY